ncbi:MAG TPA: CBS domain-containing protein [Geobacteraceae bacterium]|nr:CBS domain-containing protein [Geobacteraceae bacterium]
MKAKDIMVSDVTTISRKASLKDAVLLLKKNYGDKSFLNAAPGLVVINDWGELAGVLMPLTIITALVESAGKVSQEERTEENFFEQLCENLKDKLVEDIMEREPISVTEDAGLIDLVDLFATHRFHRIPVVREKKVVGVIYRTPLLFAMANCFFK